MSIFVSLSICKLILFHLKWLCDRNDWTTSSTFFTMSIIKIPFDALKKDSWSDQETQNAQLVLDFIQHLMNDHDFEYVLQKFGDDAYVQHNRNIPDGIKALVAYVQKFAQSNPDYTYDVKHIYADGDFVIFHSHATIKAQHRGDDTKGLNIMDTWHIQNGQITDHWDAVQPMDGFMRFYNFMTGGKVRNANGVY